MDFYSQQLLKFYKQLLSQAHEINQEDAWYMIGKYFKERCLMHQQLVSFDNFEESLQEIVDQMTSNRNNYFFSFA